MKHLDPKNKIKSIGNLLQFKLKAYFVEYDKLNHVVTKIRAPNLGTRYLQDSL